MKKELSQVKKEFVTPRLTTIKENITEIKIDQTEMIPKEDVIVMITKDGYIKRTSYRSYTATNDNPTLKENDYIIGQFEMNILVSLILFTSFCIYLHISFYAIYYLIWKDMGKHISNIIPTGENEEIIKAIPIYNFEQDQNIILASKDGMIKRTAIKDFHLSRWSKPTSCMKLKDNDKLIAVMLEEKERVFITTKNGNEKSYFTSSIAVKGVNTAGCNAITLKDDEVVSVSNFSNEQDEFLIVLTDHNTGKRIRLSEFELSTRTRKGLLVIREIKTNPYKVIRSFITDSKAHLGLKGSNITEIKVTELPISDRYSTGKEIIKNNIDDVFIYTDLIKKEDFNSTDNKETPVPKKDRINLQEIDDRLLTIDDFLN